MPLTRFLRTKIIAANFAFDALQIWEERSFLVVFLERGCILGRSGVFWANFAFEGLQIWGSGAIFVVG